jgi:excinuclease ABC subunit B
MRKALDETDRRRAKQQEYNKANGITPKGVQKRIADVMRLGYEDGVADIKALKAAETKKAYESLASPELVGKRIAKLEKEMKAAATNLEFEKAAKLRDEIRRLREAALVSPI